MYYTIRRVVQVVSKVVRRNTQDMTTPTEPINRASTVSLRLSPTEAEQLRERAERAGMSVSALIRAKLFESAPSPSLESVPQVAPSVGPARFTGSAPLSAYQTGGTFNFGGLSRSVAEVSYSR